MSRIRFLAPPFAALNEERITAGIFGLNVNYRTECPFSQQAKRLCSDMPIASINPATGEKLKDFQVFTVDQLENCLNRAERVFSHHRREPFELQLD